MNAYKIEVYKFPIGWIWDCSQAQRTARYLEIYITTSIFYEIQLNSIL